MDIRYIKNNNNRYSPTNIQQAANYCILTILFEFTLFRHKLCDMFLHPCTHLFNCYRSS